MRRSFFTACLLTFGLFVIVSCDIDKQESNQNTDANDSISVLSSYDSLNLLIEENPTDPLLYNKRANYYLLAGQNNQALSDVNKALQLDTLDARIWVTLSDVYFNSERFVDSRDVLLKAIKLDPDNSLALLKLARLYFIYKEYNTAMNYLDMALKSDPLMDEAYFLRAMTHAEKGDTTNALINYQNAVEINPGFYDAWIELGNIYQAKGDKIAEQYFRNAFDLDTNNIHAQYILAYYYQESGELEKAIDQYNFLLLKEPNKNAFFNIGFIFLVYLQDYPQAIIYFQKALNLDENYYQALFNLAYSLELSGDIEDASVKYKELLQKVPNHEKALERLNNLN